MLDAPCLLWGIHSPLFYESVGLLTQRCLFKPNSIIAGLSSWNYLQIKLHEEQELVYFSIYKALGKAITENEAVHCRELSVYLLHSLTISII